MRVAIFAIHFLLVAAASAIEAAPLLVLAAAGALGTRTSTAVAFFIVSLAAYVTVIPASALVAEVYAREVARRRILRNRRSFASVMRWPSETPELKAGLDRELHVYERVTAKIISLWRARHPIFFGLEPINVFTVAFRTDSQALPPPAHAVSFPAMMGPSLLFVYAAPSDLTPHDRFELFHELGHVGYRGIRRILLAYAGPTLNVVGLVTVLVSLRGPWRWLAAWFAMDLVSELVFRNSVLKSELIADGHAVTRLHSIGRSSDVERKLRSMERRATLSRPMLAEIEFRMRRGYVQRCHAAGRGVSLQGVHPLSLIFGAFLVYAGWTEAQEPWWLVASVATLSLIALGLGYLALGVWIGTADQLHRAVYEAKSGAELESATGP